MSTLLYADHAATTPMCVPAREAMCQALAEDWGNPSSLYTLGQQEKDKLEQARATVAELLGCDPREVVFTSGGSEADNQALRSAAARGARAGKRHIISTAFEHHAILHTLKALEKEGFSVTLLPVHEDGFVRPEELAAAITPETCLVSVMTANNEIGTIQPIRALAEIAHAHKVLFHTDAVQAVGHIPVDVSADGVDMLSLSGHKFGGPKGIGCLVARRGVLLQSLIQGGAQENGRRAGTENLPAILGLAAALSEACAHREERAVRVTALRNRLIDGILQAVPHTVLNGAQENRLPGNANFCFEGIEGESLLLLLDEAGICASSGSACASGSLDPSHVLLAIGRPAEVAHGSLRLTLGQDNTEADVDRILTEVPRIVGYLRSISPVWRDLQEGKRQYVIQ